MVELDPQQVRIPGILVDAVVVASGDEHMQTFAEHLNPAYCGRGSRGGEKAKAHKLDAKKISARRGCAGAARRGCG